MSEAREFRRILVLEDDQALRAAMARRLHGPGTTVLQAGSAAEALALLSPPPDLIIADVRLPDGSARIVLEEAARVWPLPCIVAVSGVASADEAFDLAQMGVRAYLRKPFSLEDLGATVEEVRRHPPRVDPFIAQFVGIAGLRQVNERVSRVMLRQALALAGGSRRNAARLLDVSRQAVQQRLRNLAPGHRERRPVEPPRPPT